MRIPDYRPPQAEFLSVRIFGMLASSNNLYNEDNNTEYIDEYYGGLI